MRPKLLATLIGAAALVCVGAGTAFVLWQGWLPLPTAELLPRLTESFAPGALLPRAAEPGALSPQAAKPVPTVESGEATGAIDEPIESTLRPSFDIVRIEPTGEGVIAGRAQPGWKVTVQSNDAEVAEAVADAQGEWTVVLDTPLSGGEHTLSLKATSPDQAQAVPSTQQVATTVTQTATPPLRSRPAAVASIGGNKPVPSSSDGAVAVPPETLGAQDKPDVYTILPGDTLWDIAKRYLGAGWRYTSIYQGNRKIIRDPDLILPEQRVKLPEEP